MNTEHFYTKKQKIFENWIRYFSNYTFYWEKRENEGYKNMYKVAENFFFFFSFVKSFQLIFESFLEVEISSQSRGGKNRRGIAWMCIRHFHWCQIRFGSSTKCSLQSLQSNIANLIFVFVLPVSQCLKNTQKV